MRTHGHMCPCTQLVIERVSIFDTRDCQWHLPSSAGRVTQPTLPAPAVSARAQPNRKAATNKCSHLLSNNLFLLDALLPTDPSTVAAARSSSVLAAMPASILRCRVFAMLFGGSCCLPRAGPYAQQVVSAFFTASCPVPRVTRH